MPTLLSVAERHNDHRAEVGEDGYISVSTSYIVRYDSASALNLLAAPYASGIPSKGDVFPGGSTSPSMTLRTKTARPHSDQDRRTYIVECNYSNKPAGGTGGTPNTTGDQPWDDDPLFDYDFTEYASRPRYDKTSPTPLEYLNTAGHPFDPPHEIPLVGTRIIITRNTQDYNPETARNLTNTINAGEVTIDGVTYAVGVCRLKRWSGRQAVFTTPGGSQETYWQEVIEIEYKPDGFDLVIPNMGLKDASGVIYNSPVYLDASGNWSLSATFRTFKPYALSSWSSLVA